MFRNFGLCKRPLLAVLGVLVASTLATANAATIDMSQLTSNGAKPVVISSTAANQNSAAPIVKYRNQYSAYYKGGKYTCIYTNFCHSRKGNY